MFNIILKLTGAYILLLKTLKSNLQCMNVDNNLIAMRDCVTNQVNTTVNMLHFCSKQVGHVILKDFP